MAKDSSDEQNSQTPSDALVRLSKLMSERGLCSRREADQYIEQGLVFVDGQRINQLGTKVSPNCRIELAAKAQENQDSLVTLILNKPVGYVSAQPEKDYQPAIQLITAENFFEGTNKKLPRLDRRFFEGLAVAGRLDIDSQGILLFTQDGRLARKIIGENSEIEKEYLVRYKGELSQDKLQQLRFGLSLDGKALKRARVDRLNEDQLRFVLREGKKRQIRRMMELVDLHVIGLKRVRIGQLRLGKLPEGQWRIVDPNEEI
ncbi:MAG: pseudouridylate synthase [Pseudomonadota bacterium]|jgi:23S rRNA pseudouridine2604 synthase